MRQGWLWYALCVVIVSGWVWVPDAMAASRLLEVRSAPHTVAVLELYTSEG
jgi:hypothetical protein